MSPITGSRRRRTMSVGMACAALLGAGALSAPAVQAAEDNAGPAPYEALDASLAAIEETGIPGVYSAARDGSDTWQGAAGVADLRSERPVQPQMHHRVGSITKTFTAVALMQRVAAGQLTLDAPVAEVLPGVLPKDLASSVTVRMLLNHTSGIGDYVTSAFPSLLEGSTVSLDRNRFRNISAPELAQLGLDAPRTGEPGERHAYSNTNYILAGMVLEEVTGQDPESYITEYVIEAAGLRHTYFSESAFISGPHSRMYESFHGAIDPPRDYSVYDMSWAGTAGAIVAPMEDLNRFYAALFGGKLLGPDELAEMRRTVPVEDTEGNPVGAYGLGLYPATFSCGTFWGHDGAVWGAGTIAFSSPDGERQAALGFNLMKYQSLDENGWPEPHDADPAMITHLDQALCGTEATPPGSGADAAESLARSTRSSLAIPPTPGAAS